DDPRAPGVLRQPRAPGRGSPPPQRDAPRGGSRSGSRTDDRGYPPGRSYDDPYQRGGYPPRDQHFPPRADDSAEYSAEYGTPSAGDSAEYSAEYGTPSVEYDARSGYGAPDYAPRSYDPRGGYDPRGNYSQAGAPFGGWDVPAGAGPAALGPRRPAAGFPQGAPPHAKPRRRRAGGIIAAMLVLVLAVLALGVGYLERGAIFARLGRGATTTTSTFAAYTPGPTPTVLPKYRQFVSRNARYVLNFPQSWNTTSVATPSDGLPDFADTFTQSTPPAMFFVERAQVFDPLSDSDTIAVEIQAAKHQGYSFTQTGAATTVIIGGEQWLRQEYDAVNHGSKVHYAFLATHHLGRGYAITLVALPADFTAEDTTSFAAISKTFRFL
ncbi:MAG: hypothetical protein ACHQ4H_08260, partial [Ktedonobacterales bacterium]